MGRRPERYDGTGLTTKSLENVLPSILQQVRSIHADRSDFILASWPEIVGQQISIMTQAIAFRDGILTVKVKNSSLYSLLSLHEKSRVIRKLRKKFPKSNIRDIVFRMG